MAYEECSHLSTPFHVTETCKRNCSSDRFLLLHFLQLDQRLENKVDSSDSQEKNNSLYRCVVRPEIKDCEFFCDGTGHGGDQNTLQQG